MTIPVKSFYDSTRRKIKRYLLSYSRFILMVKTWMFSLAALCLGLFFLYPQLTEQKKLFTVSISSDIMSEAQSIKITNLRLYGADDRKAPYVITAKEAEERDPGSKIIILNSPMADLVTADNEAVNITSKTGTADQKQEKLSLYGNVEIFSSQGYEVQSEELHFDTKSNIITSEQTVNAKGDFGTLVAEGIEITDDGKKIFFKGNTQIKLFER